jgi:hypothetical protein
MEPGSDWDDGVMQAGAAPRAATVTVR